MEVYERNFTDRKRDDNPCVVILCLNNVFWDMSDIEKMGLLWKKTLNKQMKNNKQQFVSMKVILEY